MELVFESVGPMRSLAEAAAYFKLRWLDFVGRLGGVSGRFAGRLESKAVEFFPVAAFEMFVRIVSATCCRQLRVI